MKFALPLLVSCFVAYAWAVPTTPGHADLEVDIRADETDSARVTTEIEANVVQIEVGRSLRNVGQEIKKLAAEMKDSGEDVSPYGIRDFFSRIKNSIKDYFKERARKVKESFSEAKQKYGPQVKSVLKEAARKAFDAGMEHIQERVTEIVMKKFAGVSGMYAVEDNVKPLRETLTALGDDLERLGMALELQGLGVPAEEEPF